MHFNFYNRIDSRIGDCCLFVCFVYGVRGRTPHIDIISDNMPL